MAEEDRKLLEAVRNWRPPKELHPIAMVAFGVYDQAGSDLPPSALQDLRKVLEDYGNDLEALALAMEGMTRFMVYIGENLGDKDNAEKVAGLLREYAMKFEPFWRRVAEALAAEGEDVQGAFAELVGEQDSARRSAPLYGAKAPEGTVRLADIAPPPRPPPWVPNKDKS